MRKKIHRAHASRRLLGLAILMCLAGAVRADFKEYELKAIYMERITRFLKWPGENDARQQESNPFVIGILGKNPFNGMLNEIYEGEQIKGRPIEIRELSALHQVDQCHILFISRSKKKELPAILAATAGKPILTIGDTKGFAEEGVMVDLTLSGTRIQFVINQAAFADAGIVVDSLMLKVAKVVEPLNSRN